MAREFSETTITDAVIERMATTPDPRTLEVLTSLVTHLHAFARETRLTVPEWMNAIEFLTRTGQTCTDTRQEFILLSDTLGLSMLVDVINHATGGTESTVLGPFYVPNIAVSPNGSDITNGRRGQPMLVESQVTNIAGTPIAEALVEVWHSDDAGFYDVQQPELPFPALRGTFRTDERGRFSFWSIYPHFYPIPTDGPVGEMLMATKRHPFRPAHVHFMISAPCHERLVTHVFTHGDPYLDSDAVFAVKHSLVNTFAEMPAGPAPDGRTLDRPWRHLAYDFRLVPS